MAPGPLVLRAREDSDYALLAVSLELTHRRDRYPYRWPPGGHTGPDAVRRFLYPADALGAWVVCDEEGAAGQIVLEPDRDQGTVSWPELTGLPAGSHAVVSRLFVDPRARRRGGFRLLLDAAVERGHEAGLRVVLDVFEVNAIAHASYLALGWRELGRGEFLLYEGLREPLVYLTEPGT